MRRAKPPGEQQNPGGTTPSPEGREARADQGGKHPHPRGRGESPRGEGRRHPRPDGRKQKPQRETTRDARKKGDRGKSALEGSEAERGLKTLRMKLRKTTRDFHWIKVHNGCSETQLNTPIDGRMAKQQPTSGEPEKLKAQVHFQEPNDEQYGAND